MPSVRRLDDGHGGVGHGGGPERRAVHGAHYGEQRERARQQVASEESEIEEQSYEQHALARERVDDETAERTHEQRRERIARQHQAYHVLAGREMLAQIERQQRCEHIKCKCHAEIGSHHPQIIPVPEFLAFHAAKLQNICEIGTQFAREETKGRPALFK